MVTPLMHKHAVFLAIFPTLLFGFAVVIDERIAGIKERLAQTTTKVWSLASARSLLGDGESLQSPLCPLFPVCLQVGGHRGCVPFDLRHPDTGRVLIPQDLGFPFGKAPLTIANGAEVPLVNPRRWLLWMTAFRPLPQGVPDQVVHCPASPRGGAVPLIVGPAPHVWVQTADDLRCWTLPVVLPRGFDGAVVSVPLGLLGLRPQGPFGPLYREPQEVKPFGTLPHPGFGFTELPSSSLQKSFQRGEHMRFESFPRRGDGHDVIRRADATSAFIAPCFPGWSLGVSWRIFPIEELVHPIEGDGGKAGCNAAALRGSRLAWGVVSQLNPPGFEPVAKRACTHWEPLKQCGMIDMVTTTTEGRITCPWAPALATPAGVESCESIHSASSWPATVGVRLTAAFPCRFTGRLTSACLTRSFWGGRPHGLRPPLCFGMSCRLTGLGR